MRFNLPSGSIFCGKTNGRITAQGKRLSHYGNKTVGFVCQTVELLNLPLMEETAFTPWRIPVFVKVCSPIDMRFPSKNGSRMLKNGIVSRDLLGPLTSVYLGQTEIPAFWTVTRLLVAANAIFVTIMLKSKAQ